MYFSYLVVLFYCHFIWFYLTCLNLINGGIEMRKESYPWLTNPVTGTCTGCSNQKSKLLSQYNSLLFLSHPVCWQVAGGRRTRFAYDLFCLSAYPSQTVVIPNYNPNPQPAIRISVTRCITVLLSVELNSENLGWACCMYNAAQWWPKSLKFQSSWNSTSSTSTVTRNFSSEHLSF